MGFKKTLMFLGIKRRVGSNGASYYVDMYCPDGENWQFFIRDLPENNEVISRLMRLGCGSLVDCDLYAGNSRDKGSYIRLIGVEDAA